MAQFFIQAHVRRVEFVAETAFFKHKSSAKTAGVALFFCLIILSERFQPATLVETLGECLFYEFYLAYAFCQTVGEYPCL